MRPPIDQGTVIVTGASSGIGLALAELLAERAGTLVLVARRRDRLEELAERLRAKHASRVVVQPCDLADAAARTALIDELQRDLGSIDVVINNAGFGDNCLFEQAAWSKLEQMFQLNVVALTHLCHAFVGPMVERGRGGILNISSGLGLQFLPGYAAYAGTKHYVTGFTEALRLEVAPRGVVVSQVCPGPVETEFAEVAQMTERPPTPLRISAAQCARESLAGFDAGRALIVPGGAMKVTLGLGRMTPRVVQRLIYRPVVSRLRA